MTGTIFDAMFNSQPRIDMYRSWVIPELFEGQPQPVLKNWPAEDLEAFVGGPYAKGVK